MDQRRRFLRQHPATLRSKGKVRRRIIQHRQPATVVEVPKVTMGKRRIFKGIQIENQYIHEYGIECRGRKGRWIVIARGLKCPYF